MSCYFMLFKIILFVFRSATSVYHAVGCVTLQSLVAMMTFESVSISFSKLCSIFFLIFNAEFGIM